MKNNKCLNVFEEYWNTQVIKRNSKSRYSVALAEQLKNNDLTYDIILTEGLKNTAWLAWQVA